MAFTRYPANPRAWPIPTYSGWTTADLLTEGERLIDLTDRASSELSNRLGNHFFSPTGYEVFTLQELRAELDRLFRSLRAVNRNLVPGARRCTAPGRHHDEHATHLGAV